MEQPAGKVGGGDSSAGARAECWCGNANQLEQLSSFNISLCLRVLFACRFLPLSGLQPALDWLVAAGARCIVVSGAGKNFCAGMDLASLMGELAPQQAGGSGSGSSSDQPGSSGSSGGSGGGAAGADGCAGRHR